jgi:hypothetical protein
MRIVGHDRVPFGASLAAEVAREIVRWDISFRRAKVAITMPSGSPEPGPRIGRYVLDRAENPIIVSWT